MLKGKTILLGVSGSIAAYKAAALCSKLRQAGADVRVVMTKSAAQLVQPMTFQALSRHHVMVDTFDERDAEAISHIDVAARADLAIVAPASANILAKMANGIADDMLSTTLLAVTSTVLVAPAMNVHMYEHPATQRNLEILRERGVRFVDPTEGELACGDIGKGKMAEPEFILAAIEKLLNSDKPLAGRRVLVTAGGTMERIDPVRYITNDSSGKMGFAIAEAARDMGADVTLVYGLTHTPVPAGVRAVSARSAEDMLNAVLSRVNDVDVVIKAAAVADYRPAEQAAQKLKKNDSTMTLTLVKNPDILQTIGALPSHPFLVGFAAETESLADYAMDKLRRKNCDLLVANDVSKEGAGFGTDTNIVSVFDRDGLAGEWPLLSKREVAERLLKLIANRLPSNDSEMPGGTR